MNGKAASLLSVLLLLCSLSVVLGQTPTPRPKARQVPVRKTPKPTPAKTPRPGQPKVTPTPTPGIPTTGNYTFALQVDELERRYIVHVPPRYDGKTPVPLVIVLHGGGTSPRTAMSETGWMTKADLAAFLVVFPEAMTPDPKRPSDFFGNPAKWNDGSTSLPPALRDVDDVGFISALLDEMITQYSIDETRVFVSGFSNGGSMALRLGVELSDRIAAVAAVAGYLFRPKNPKLEFPVSMIYFVGTDDPLVPLNGGEVRMPGGRFEKRPPAADAAEQWANVLGCRRQPLASQVKEGVQLLTYGPGMDGTEVAFYTIEGLGHTWPGGKRFLPERIVGKTSNRIKATDVIWNFFRTHAKKRVPA